MVVGEGLAPLQNKVLKENGLDFPNGRKWATVFGKALSERPKLAAIKRTTRSRLMECMRNREAIEEWLFSLPDSERVDLNHPTTVLAR